MATSSSQCSPENPGTHEHMYPLVRSMHVPLFRQGFDSHSLTLVSQLSPVNLWNGLYIYLICSTVSALAFFNLRVSSLLLEKRKIDEDITTVACMDSNSYVGCELVYKYTYDSYQHPHQLIDLHCWTN